MAPKHVYQLEKISTALLPNKTNCPKYNENDKDRHQMADQAFQWGFELEDTCWPEIAMAFTAFYGGVGIDTRLSEMSKLGITSYTRVLYWALKGGDRGAISAMMKLAHVRDVRPIALKRNDLEVVTLCDKIMGPLRGDRGRCDWRRGEWRRIGGRRRAAEFGWWPVAPARGGPSPAWGQAFTAGGQAPAGRRWSQQSAGPVWTRPSPLHGAVCSGRGRGRGHGSRPLHPRGW